MPGCAGDYENPILEWIMKGLSCQDCAWENMCIEYYKENNRKRVHDIPHDLETQIKNELQE